MVHRTDIAGGRLGQASFGQASFGQPSFGTDRMCRRALKWAPPRNQSCARTSARFTSVRFSQSGGMKCCCLFTTAAPAVHPFHLHLQTP